ncbi:DEAD/DEAH box helicase [Salmonella enterica subsp. enterica]|nr:DEAD/DEAH box helicase [Salmonella enterica]EJF7575681.1 DEAD/DEAH box helicase [Salmonella enterica subsp. enterica]
MAVALRDYQDDAVCNVRFAFREVENVILVLATGAGKTVIFSEITRLAKEKGSRVLILAHRDTLIKQCSRKLTDIGTSHGIIMAGFTPAPHESVQVGSVQTVVRRLEKIRWKPDIIIIDECHLSAANTYVTIRNHFPSAKLLGVTGSPCRLDNKPLGSAHGGLYDRMVVGISIGQLIERGYLVPPRVFAPSEAIDLSGLRPKSGSDFNVDLLAEKMNKPKLTGNAVRQYREVCYGKPAVAWCVNIAHATAVADAFNAEGIPAAMLCGDHDTPYRDEVLGKLARGEIMVVTFVGLLVEGVDVPEIACVILLRPTMSLSSYLQTIGRGLRPLPGKDCCYVLDHAGLTFRHGFADEERDWSLDWGERQKRKKAASTPAITLEQCPGCGAVFSPASGLEAAERKRAEQPDWGGEMCCPNCWHDVARKSRDVNMDEGQMEEITPEMAKRMKAAKRREVGEADTLEKLLQVAAMRGYNSAWAYRIFAGREEKQRRIQNNQMTSRIERMIETMGGWGISRDMLEEYLGHALEFTVPDELDQLTQVWRSLKQGVPVSEFFKTPNGELPFF